MPSNKQNMIERRFTKWEKWYDNNLRDFSQVQESAMWTMVQNSHHEILETMYAEESSKMDWKCYVCHTPIKVDLKKVSIKSVFCEEHKPKRLTKSQQRDGILLRWINMMFEEARRKMKSNSDIPFDKILK